MIPESTLKADVKCEDNTIIYKQGDKTNEIHLSLAHCIIQEMIEGAEAPRIAVACRNCALHCVFTPTSRPL